MDPEENFIDWLLLSLYQIVIIVSLAAIAFYLFLLKTFGPRKPQVIPRASPTIIATVDATTRNDTDERGVTRSASRSPATVVQRPSPPTDDNLLVIDVAATQLQEEAMKRSTVEAELIEQLKHELTPGKSQTLVTDGTETSPRQTPIVLRTETEEEDEEEEESGYSFDGFSPE